MTAWILRKICITYNLFSDGLVINGYFSVFKDIYLLEEREREGKENYFV